MVDQKYQAIIFDFNSLGESWRAIEPYRIFKFSDDCSNGWLGWERDKIEVAL